MNVARKLLDAMDGFLNAKVELTLYGRAAISLGFDRPPPEAAFSKDVDAVLWIGQAEELLATNFWEAIDAVNRRFEDCGFFISHLFSEDQVILTPQWRERRVRIDGPWERICLSRLGDADLLLSKLMRDDPADLQDALFIRDAAQMSESQVRTELAAARCPPIPELVAQFHSASERFLTRLAGNPEKH